MKIDKNGDTRFYQQTDDICMGLHTFKYSTCNHYYANIPGTQCYSICGALYKFKYKEILCLCKNLQIEVIFHHKYICPIKHHKCLQCNMTVFDSFDIAKGKLRQVPQETIVVLLEVLEQSFSARILCKWVL